MTFNFDTAIKEAAGELKNDKLFAIVLAPSGGGKSSLMGTFPGKTLYLYTSGEDHGPKAARALGGDAVIPLCVDMADGEKLSGDAAYERLLSIIESHDDIAKLGVDAIAIDGMSELEAMVRGTDKWAAMCKTSKGAHSGFEEPRATITMLRPLIDGLKSLQRKCGVHVATSLILNVTELGRNGEILEANPRLQGFSVAESILQQFSDVVVVGRMEKAGKIKHKIQFLTEISKASKDEAGRMKKAMNFSPRLSGMTLDKLPALVDANFAELLSLRGSK
jgi:hypothetical protein